MIDAEQFIAELRPLALSHRRRIVAIAGPPASGKSTLAALVVDTFNDEQAGTAALVGMDGFHLDNQLLDARDQRSRKGAPFTFDTGGLTSTLRRLRANDEASVVLPVYDRALSVARGGAVEVASSVPLVVVEGNYLLLDESPWRGLSSLFDVTAYLEIEERVLEQRLVDRWETHGLTPAQGREKIDGNDLPNARYVAANSRPAHHVIVG